MKKLVRIAFESPEQTELRDSNSSVPVFVGKRVSHIFCLGDEQVSYNGKVIGTVPGHPSWYRILYDGDMAEYTYDLLEDYRQGNLQVLGMLPKTLKSYAWYLLMIINVIMCTLSIMFYDANQ